MLHIYIYVFVIKLEAVTFV